MADKAVFVSDLRSAVSAMIDSYSRVATLANFAVTMGWTTADFASIFSGADITADEFFAALTSIGTLAATFGSESQVLAKLKP